MTRDPPFSCLPHGATTWWTDLGRCVGAALLALACLYPFYVALAASLRALLGLFGRTPWPAVPDASVAGTVMVRAAAHLLGSGWTPTLTLPMVAIVMALFLGVTADYAFGPAWRGLRARLLTVLGLTLMPQLAALAGLFDALRTLRLYNHWWGLATPYLTFTLPFVVWAVMGCTGRDGGRRSFGSVLRPALLATGLVAYIAAWNEFMYALVPVLDSTQEARPGSGSVGGDPGVAEAAWLVLLSIGPLAVAGIGAWRWRAAQRRATAATRRPRS